MIERQANRKPLEQLRTVPLRVIASGRQEEVEALLGALNLVNCNVLITNEAAARELLLRRS
jgi:deoxyribonucleoside regulator